MSSSEEVRQPVEGGVALSIFHAHIHILESNVRPHMQNASFLKPSVRECWPQFEWKHGRGYNDPAVSSARAQCSSLALQCDVSPFSIPEKTRFTDLVRFSQCPGLPFRRQRERGAGMFTSRGVMRPAGRRLSLTWRMGWGGGGVCSNTPVWLDWKLISQQNTLYKKGKNWTKTDNWITVVNKYIQIQRKPLYSGLMNAV